MKGGSSRHTQRTSDRAVEVDQRRLVAAVDHLLGGTRFEADLHALAEREIFLKKQLDEAFSAQKFEDAEKIKQQIASERSRFEEDREAEKERVRREKRS